MHVRYSWKFGKVAAYNGIYQAQEHVRFGPSGDLLGTFPYFTLKDLLFRFVCFVFFVVHK